MPNRTSQHILNTAANLLGFCLFVITSLHISSYSGQTLIDEFTSIVALLLAASCMLSFISIRSSHEQRSDRFELIADYLFMSALVGILVIIIYMTRLFL